MQKLWCWRCQMDVAMLEEREFFEMADLYSEAMEGTKRFRENTGADLKHPTINDLFKPVRDKYEQLTGMKESNHNAIVHHRLALYGAPCTRCGKPLRTPKAKFCASCGFSVSESSS